MACRRSQAVGIGRRSSGAVKIATSSTPRNFPNARVEHGRKPLVLLSVPLIILYQMQMDLSKKIRLGFLFSIGAVSTIVSGPERPGMKSGQQNQSSSNDRAL